MRILQRRCILFAVFLLIPLGQLSAQVVGSDNPTGISGIFNGNITTGCSYDPYTGNAVRSVTDIVVAGGVGQYPLALSRIYNSRTNPHTRPTFSVGWCHSYNWIMENSATGTTTSRTPPSNYQPPYYTVDFPDGRSEVFWSVNWDSDYRCLTAAWAPAGVHDRFQPLNTSTLLAYLVLPDGGKVEFKATLNSEWDGEQGLTSYWYTYVAQAIIDPYGQRTSFTYDGYGRLTQVTEPAQRNLQFFYTTTTGSIIDHVTASDGRTVQYDYGTFSPGGTVYTVLVWVVYYGQSPWTAHYTYAAPNVGSVKGVPLLSTCDEPLFSGPMKRIAYTYATGNNGDGSAAAYGQILSENYYSGTSVGGPVSTLAINTANTRTETRGDGPTRTFTYTNAMVTIAKDFMAVAASQAYDGYGYINSVTDRNSNVTTFSDNTLTGGLTQITYPLTPEDTPNQGSTHPTVSYAYGGDPNCYDGNTNADATNPYYVCTATDEGGNATRFTRDTNKRVTRIDYPDGGYETFTYDPSYFNLLSAHRMTTGGTETFSYDGTGLKQTYRDPYHASNTPSAWYQYDGYGRVSGVTDALGGSSGDTAHTTSFSYDLRGQMTTTTSPKDANGNRHTLLVNVYYPDGTLHTAQDALANITSYIYDDYRRPLTVTTPGHNTQLTTSYYYNGGGTSDTTNDYTHTDSNVTHLTTPNGNFIANAYDPDYRKLSVTRTASDGQSDWAMTSYRYDNQGNLTSVIAPNEQGTQFKTVSYYDERNRLMSVNDSLYNTTSFTYDTAGRKKTVQRPNGQTITYNLFDSMNRVTQQTVTQDPEVQAVTLYTYYTPADGSNAPVGLLHTMQDPHLIGIHSSDNYSYGYDSMGRKTSVAYPPDSNNLTHREYFWYDTVGHLYQYQNRNAALQTLTYDERNRLIYSSWNDGTTQPVSFGYDVASRLTSITNANATISRIYFNDNLLNTETSTYYDNTARTVTYSYDGDGNRATLQYPANAYSFTYSYTGRDQLKTILDNNSATVATYWYDLDGNMVRRTPNNSTTSTYTYDALDRVLNITHSLASSNTRTLVYGYDAVSNRTWVERDGPTGDAFGYDLNDQMTAGKLNIPTPDQQGAAGSQTISYDANGNRVAFGAYNTTDIYTTNELNQYSSRNSTNATYDANGNLIVGLDGSTYSYDAQNRLLSAAKGGTTETFTYDGLNRQVSRTINHVITYNVYDGWDLIGEYASGANTPTAAYVGGAGGLVKNLVTNRYYYQDASGSTSHLADSSGNLLEWYRYDLQGTPIFYNAGNTQILSSNYGVRHLFTGQQWYSELGLYDLRNRYYSPDIGRFLQPDPIGFNGDATNLYRYCHNNPLKFTDPTGENILIEITAALMGGLFVYYDIILPAYQSISPQPDSRPPSGLSMNPDSLQRWATPQWDTPLPYPPGSISAPPEKQLPDDLENSDQNPDPNPFWRELRGPEREMLYMSGSVDVADASSQAQIYHVLPDGQKIAIPPGVATVAPGSWGPNLYGSTGQGFYPGGGYVNAFGGTQMLGAGSVASILAGGTTSSWDIDSTNSSTLTNPGGGWEPNPGDPSEGPGVNPHTGLALTGGLGVGGQIYPVRAR